LKKIFRSKWIKIPLYFFTICFALIGAFLTIAYFAIYFKWTNESGAVDGNSRVLQVMSDKYQVKTDKDSLAVVAEKYEALNRILILKKYYPKNAQHILASLESNHDYTEALRMVESVDMLADKTSPYYLEVVKYRENKYQPVEGKTSKSIYHWMNTSEWDDFKIAVEKDKKVIDSVAKMTGVESRLIVCCLIGEQMRLFNSDREAYKKWIGPLKILSVESKFSLGVTGIKELTAQTIEKYLKDSTSAYYLGKKYEKLLDFKTDNPAQERIDRLISFRNHYYSYMYAAVFLKQVKHQWERRGFPIDNRPEILSTLFNVGFPQSVPKKDPKVGGSTIKIKEKPISFGMIGYQFYYSGELCDLFPIHTKKFDWNEI
jgi:hypothetical protein